MKSQKILQGILILLVLGLGACGENSASQSQTVQSQTALFPTAESPTSTPVLGPTLTATPDFLQGTVSIWHSLNEPEISTLVQVIVDFQNIYPDSQFDVLYLPENILLERYRQAAQDSTGPALLLGPADWAYELADEGLVKDLREQVKNLKDRVTPGALQSGLVGDVQAGLPYSTDGVALYRNASIIPDSAASWDDLVKQAQAAAQPELVGAMLDRSFAASGAHLLGLGGELMNPDFTPAFNSDSGLDWVALLQSFEQAGPVDFQTDQDREKFLQGTLGYFIDSTSIREDLADQIGSQNLRIDPWPAHEKGYLSGFLMPQMAYLNAKVDDQNEPLARMFIDFLLSPEEQARLAEIGLIPAVVDAPVQDPLIVQAVEALKLNSAIPASPWTDLYRTALDSALQSIFNGQATVEDALAAAEAVILEAQASAQSTPTP